MLFCYYARCSALDLSGEPCARLPRWRQEAFSPLRHESARRLSLGAGLLWAEAMRRNGFDPDAPVHRLAAGKPVTAAVHFSLSHSGDICLCAVSDRSVGADVQEPRPVRLSVARRFCPEEQAYLQTLPASAQPDALLRLWTRKEAWVKAASESRMLALDEYCVLADADGFVFSDFVLSDGSFAAVCGSEAISELIEVHL